MQTSNSHHVVRGSGIYWHEDCGSSQSYIIYIIFVFLSEALQVTKGGEGIYTSM